MSLDNQTVLRQVPHLRRFAMSLLRSRDEADELVHDCLARALSNTISLEDGTSLRFRLFTILYTLFIDGRRRAGGPVLAPGHASTRRAGSVPRQENGPLLWALGEAIGELPKAQRFLLLLVSIEGFSYEEAAAVAGIPVATVRSRLSRARATLRHRLDLHHREKATDRNGHRQATGQRRGTECTA